jgi:hypothetical protein
VPVGNTFTTDIDIANVTDLQGADITINYDSTKMTFQSFSVGSALVGTVSPFTFSSGSCSAGTCQFIILRLGDAFNGSGTLFTITWLAEPRHHHRHRWTG